MNILSKQARPVDDTFAYICLLFKLSVLALKNLYSLPCPHVVCNCLPLEALRLEQILQLSTDLEFSVLILIVVETSSDYRAMHGLPDMIKRQIESLLILVFVND